MNAVTATRVIEEIVEGLQQDEKTISPKFFYDERGSKLFDRITTLPEYLLEVFHGALRR